MNPRHDTSGYIEDLSSDVPIIEIEGNMENLRAVGYISKDHSFVTGAVPSAVIVKLRALIEHDRSVNTPLMVILPLRVCNICAKKNAASEWLHLFIPTKNCLYVCPGLIVHYIEVHGYLPPPEFLAAVEAMPAPGTEEYKQLWRQGAGLHPSADPGRER